LNGDGVIGPVVTTIGTDGSTSLTQVGSNYFLYVGGTGPALKYGGAAIVAGQFGSWAPIGAEQTASGYEVAWKLAGADDYGVWSTDGGGNFTGVILNVVSGTGAALESIESSFHQDLNGDGVIGLNLPTTVIEADGSTSLVEVGTNYFLYAVGTSSGPALEYNGAPVVASEFGSWSPIGAEQTARGYEVAWKLAGADAYGVWSTDSSGNFNGVILNGVSGTSAVLESIESSFHQDLNGDRVIGLNLPTTVIEADGSTSLVAAGNNYFLYAVGTSSGPALEYNGAAIVAGQFGSWAPIGAEQTASGYEVAWKLAGADAYGVWSTDSSGSYVSSAIGVVSGTSAALESIETSFHQDLNGDGVIGPTTIAAGATAEIPAAYSGAITFSGSTGTLQLDNSSSFSGTVAGLTGQDTLDLRNINPTSVQTPSYSGNSSGGTLTVTDGSHAAHISLLGNYLASAFVASSDGHGGIAVVDPLLTSSGQQTVLTQPLHT
jgi:serralysin